MLVRYKSIKRPLSLISLYMLLSIYMLVGCSTTNITTKKFTGHKIKKVSEWAILPIANYSESPFAGEKIESILESILRMNGVRYISKYPKLELPGEIPLLDNHIRYQRAIEWAIANNYKYCIYGSVEEWRYKSGIENKPVVGITLHIKDIDTGTVYWTGTGSKTGVEKDSVSGVARELLTEMISRDM